MVSLNHLTIYVISSRRKTDGRLGAELKRRSFVHITKRLNALSSVRASSKGVPSSARTWKIFGRSVILLSKFQCRQHLIVEAGWQVIRANCVNSGPSLSADHPVERQEPSAQRKQGISLNPGDLIPLAGQIPTPARNFPSHAIVETGPNFDRKVIFGEWCWR